MTVFSRSREKQQKQKTKTLETKCSILKLACEREDIYIYKVIFNEDANVTKWFTEGSSEEY